MLQHRHRPSGDRFAAGRLRFGAASLVARDAPHRAAPLSSPRTESAAVTVIQHDRKLL